MSRFSKIQGSSACSTVETIINLLKKSAYRRCIADVIFQQHIENIQAAAVDNIENILDYPDYR